MSFLDDIKSRLPFGQNQDDYGQDGYDEGDGYDEYYDDGYQDDYQVADSAYGAGDGSVSEPTYRSQADPSNGVLGQTRRGEAESVAVYTRSGQLVGDADRHGATYNPPARSQDAYRPGCWWWLETR